MRFEILSSVKGKKNFKALTLHTAHCTLHNAHCSLYTRIIKDPAAFAYMWSTAILSKRQLNKRVKIPFGNVDYGVLCLNSCYLIMMPEPSPF